MFYPKVAYPTYLVGALIASAQAIAVDASAQDWGSADLAWINSPSNPTGRVHTEAELKSAIEYSRKNNTPVVSDECYLEFGDSVTPTSILNYTQGNNSNILAARVARETYGVHNVVARIYDPGRAEIYQRLGIPTVATVLWATDQILRRLVPEGSRSEWRDATGMVQLCEVHPQDDWYGRPILLIDAMTPARVAFITRLGEGLIPDEHTVLQQGDLVHVMVSDNDVARTEEILASSPEGERQ